MRPLVFIALAALAVSTPSMAQDPVMALNPTLMAGWSGSVNTGQNTSRDFGTRLAARPRAMQARPRPALVTGFSFRPDPSVRQQVHARVLQRMRKLDPDGAAKLAPMLRDGSFDRQATAYMARYGMTPNNVADATALFLASSWLATRASNADPSRGQLLGLRSQVAAAMATTPGMANASNAMKQEIAEANVIQAVITGQFATAASRDPKLAPGVRSATAKGVMSSYGIDLLRLNLTAQGLQ